MFKNLFCIALRRGSVEPLKTGGFQSSKRLSKILDNRSYKIMADCRSFNEKRNEISDKELANYLLKESSKVRRNATYKEMESDNQKLLEFKIFAIREQYLKSFII
jgi:hypothetical protein